MRTTVRVSQRQIGATGANGHTMLASRTRHVLLQALAKTEGDGGDVYDLSTLLQSLQSTMPATEIVSKSKITRIFQKDGRLSLLCFARFKAGSASPNPCSVLSRPTRLTRLLPACTMTMADVGTTRQGRVPSSLAEGRGFETSNGFGTRKTRLGSQKCECEMRFGMPRTPIRLTSGILLHHVVQIVPED
jgi:hypothetical protein